jgi:hypothetical protein
MATKIYDSGTITLIDGTELYLTPLKIKYLREFMDVFESVKLANNDDEAITSMIDCVRVAMKQYFPEIKTIDDVEDNLDLKTVYKVLDIAGGIKMESPEEDSDKPVSKKAEEGGSSWETLDLAKLESEAFLLGIWKDYEELEASMSMPEIVATLEARREIDYASKKFMAAIQGVDLDKESGGTSAQDIWEEKKAKFFSGGQAANSDDVVSLQGINAVRSGFGIGMGLEYEKLN